MLLINLVQNNDVNTQRLFGVRIRIDNEEDIISRSVAALDLIVDLFYKREDLARFVHKYTLKPYFEGSAATPFLKTLKH